MRRQHAEPTRAPRRGAEQDGREVAQLLEQLAALVSRRRLLRRRGASEQELRELGAEIGRLQWQLAGAARERAAEDDFTGDLLMAAAATTERRLAARLAERHSLRAEALGILVLYGLYEGSRGLVTDDPATATEHAHEIVALERSLHVFVEQNVQQGAHALPGLIGLLGILYLTLHLAVTGGYLVWLHRFRPAAFPVVRTTLVLASAIALLGYVLYPTAPPRLAGLGIADTVSSDHIDLNKGLVSSLYNPFAAVPSMHLGYAAIVGVSLVLHGRRPALRIAGALYPALVLLIIVATGNHFFFDALAGAAVAGVAAAIAVALVRGRAPAQRRPVSRARPSAVAQRETSELAAAA